MIHPQLPCSYTMKAKRDDISSNVVILRLPKPYFGCYRPLKEYISELLIRKVSYSVYFIILMSKLYIGEPITSPLTIKISGDGAPFHRSSSYTLFQLSISSR